MTDVVVHPLGGPLLGSVPVPSDKSIGHRALLVAALCEGVSILRNFSYGADNVSTADALRAMGVTIEDADGAVRVRGVGLFGLKAPASVLDCSNSGTTMRLLCGVLAGQTFDSTLVGDASLSSRPMMRVARPLRMRGARVEGRPRGTDSSGRGDITAPLTVSALPDGASLTELVYECPIASAQVKSAALLSGLFAHGVTQFREPTLSRDHTERLLYSLGVPLRAVANFVELDPAGWKGIMPAFEMSIPGDASAAAFLVAAAHASTGSRVTIRGVGTNPTRSGFFDVARAMGAGLEVQPQGESSGEPVAELTAWYAPLTATRLGGELIARAIDEIPILSVLAARAHGVTTVRDAEELRAKESDRLKTMAQTLRSFGVSVEECRDGLDIEGRPTPLEAADVASHGDHRVAMSAIVLALSASGPSRVSDCDCIATSFPRFIGTLRALGARIEVDVTAA